MPHDVFISYSSEDRVIADAIVSNFETNGIRCWYAPRDIGPGDDWGEAITEAIDASSVFLLIFSGHANSSKRVLDELYYSLGEEKIVIPFRVENLDPSGAMRLHLSSLHWLDAYDPSWEAHIDRLFETVSANLAKEISREREKFVPQGKIKAGTPRLLFGVVLTAIIALSVIFGLPWLRELNAGSGGDATPESQVSSPTPPATDTEAILPTTTHTVEPSPTPIPLGSVENPIVWMFHPGSYEDFEEINTAMEDIVAEFNAWNGGLTLKLIPAIDATSILTALCDGDASMGSLNPFEYLVASEQGCATVEFIWEAYADIKFGGMFVTRAESDISDLADLAGKTLCIPEYTSYSGWLLPLLELRAAGTDPDSSQITIVESGDHYLVLEDVINGRCDAGSAFYDARGGSDIENVEEVLIIIAETIAVPNENISFGSAVDEETSSLLRQFLNYLRSAGGKPDSLAKICGSSSASTHLVEINDYYYDGLKDLIERAGLSYDEVLQIVE